MKKAIRIPEVSYTVGRKTRDNKYELLPQLNEYPAAGIIEKGPPHSFSTEQEAMRIAKKSGSPWRALKIYVTEI